MRATSATAATTNALQESCAHAAGTGMTRSLKSDRNAAVQPVTRLSRTSASNKRPRAMSRRFRPTARRACHNR